MLKFSAESSSLLMQYTRQVVCTQHSGEGGRDGMPTGWNG